MAPQHEVSLITADDITSVRSPRAVVLVDPLSTGVMLQQRLVDMYPDLGVIVVFSDRTMPGPRQKHLALLESLGVEFLDVIVHETGNMDQTTNAILAKGVTIVALMCGCEFGVLLEDALADALNTRLRDVPFSGEKIRSSGMIDPKMKVDKLIQADTVRAFGLDSVKQTLANSRQDVEVFLSEVPENLKVVVKPQTGAGSVGVMFATSKKEVIEAYDTIITGEHKERYSNKYKHYEEAGVLLQELLEGTEYIVNLVVLDGVSKCTAIWKYDKRPYNGAPFVCYSKKLMALGDEDCLADILEYTQGVITSLGFCNGALHAEVMYVPNRGPVLVEMNCRLHGGNAQWVVPAEICMGYSQLSVFMDAYMNHGEGQFRSVPAEPTTKFAGCYQVKMRSHVEGPLEDVIPSQLVRIQSLKSYHSHWFTVKPGDMILKTRDMPSVPGEVTLIHEDNDQLESDYKTLNDILHEGIFLVRTASTFAIPSTLGVSAPDNLSVNSAAASALIPTI
eukprot:CAMPEP_0202441236 /NCGR_PEP_ID=MMETSP1360-20130828/677_1 /ASSEMBLY_ACC=CAM_ASM_000848 /TAXON_ID=515479 /ORGANISM="Licmophora paradoxa, Strain CCMP2313" /LENGTH=504 /DNA_ID=CAMNT_0049056093 /DNA_START=103 /DNA_END=1617 /DNA_ORIENTATION=-